MMRPLAFIWLGPKRKPGPNNAPPGQINTVPTIETPTAAIQESRGHRALFYATMISTTMALASGLTDMLTFFGKTVA
jgi:hypothetical protein